MIEGFERLKTKANHEQAIQIEAKLMNPIISRIALLVFVDIILSSEAQ